MLNASFAPVVLTQRNCHKFVLNIISLRHTTESFFVLQGLEYLPKY